MVYQRFKEKNNYNKEDRDFEKRIDIKKFFELKSILIYILSILIGMCKLPSGATPFGLALLGAIADTSYPLIVPIILISGTTLVSFGGVCFVKFIISSFIFIIAKSFIKGNSKIGNAAKILFATAISEIIVLLFSNTIIYDAVMAAFMSATTAVFYLVFSSGLPFIIDFDERKIDSHETLMAAGILITVAVSTLGDFSIGGLSVRSVICILMVLLLGWKRGATVGLISGVSISLVLGIMGIAAASTVAVYAVCGLLSGIFSRYGKIGAAIGFILGNAVWVYYINASTEVIIPIGEIVIASIILFFLPRSIGNYIDSIFENNNALEGNDPVGLLSESTIYKLDAVSELAEDMASNVENGSTNGTDIITDFIKTLSNNTCKKCANYEKCWKQNYHSMYECIFNGIECLNENNQVTVEDLKDSMCTEKKLLADGLNFSYEMYKLNKEWQSKVTENRKMMATQLKGVSKAITSTKNAITSRRETYLEKLTQNMLGAGYKLDIGIAKVKKQGSSVSGDTAEVFKLKNGQLLLGVSDGMGSGEKALKSSKKTFELLEKYINADLDKKMVIELINSYMMLGKNKDNYSTLDVAMFNPDDASLNFIKYGACPTYIKQDGKVKSISSVSLPIGASFKIEPNIFKDTSLGRGDYFVIVSDGILDAKNNDTEWIKELLNSITTTKPQRVADIILQEAIDTNYGAISDDMTVVVAKVC